MHKYFILTAFLSLLFTTACGGPSRETADKKMAIACKNFIKILSSAQAGEIDITKTSFHFDKGYEGVSLRVVTLAAGNEKTYTCAYKEQRSIFGYSLQFYHLEKDGLKYGNFEGRIQGDLGDLIKINQETERALAD